MSDVIYYARFCCRIKIGFTHDLASAVQSIPHDKVLATEAGTTALERKRHKQFFDYSLGEQWYSMAPALTAHIRSIRAGTPKLAHRLISTQDAMAYTNRDRHTLYRWAKEGKLTRYPVGTSVRWDILELPAHKPGSSIAVPSCEI